MVNRSVMNHDYDQLRQRAVDIENRFRNMLDVPGHKISAILRDEFTSLIVDIRNQKHPKTLEDRVYKIQRHLIESRDDGIMRIDENVELHKHCENFRMELRKFSSYQT